MSSRDHICSGCRKEWHCLGCEDANEIIICEECKMKEEQVEDVFTYHSCGPEEEKKYVAIRGKAKEMAQVLFAHCPPSADRSAALRKLRECVMTANASVALKGLV